MEINEGLDPAACSLDAADGMARRQRWLDLADRALITKAATPTGVQLRYRPGIEFERELRQLASLETECCSFATWSVTSDDDGVILDVSSHGEGVASVQAMFGEAPPLPVR